jgi:hypothetical protein
MKLTINNIRKAKGNSLLGFCNSKYLSRGLGIKFLNKGNKFYPIYDLIVNIMQIDGGSVFGVKVRVLKVCQKMAKFSIGTGKSLILDNQEIEELENILDGLKHHDLSRIEYSKELRIEEILNDITCEEWLKKLLIVRQPIYYTFTFL